MTCLVAVVDGPRVILGSDSYGGDGNLGAAYGPKVAQVGPYGIAVSAEWRVLQLLTLAFDPPPPPTDPGELHRFLVTDWSAELRRTLTDHGWEPPKAEDTESWDGLIAVAGRIFEVQADGAILEPTAGYTARGAGAAVALGALHSTFRRPAKVRALAALQAAEAHVPSVRRPFHVLTV